MNQAPRSGAGEPGLSGPAGTPPATQRSARRLGLRQPVPLWQAVPAGAMCVLLVLAIWFLLTWGAAEERILGPGKLPSPGETFSEFKSLWFERELARNTVASLQRVILGFGLATLVGVPVGILCGCFGWAKAFFAPVTIFGRNVPIAALIPLTFALFGIGELQKVMFIFIASVAFIIADTAQSVAKVSSNYIDTAFTLGANRRQTILKVLVPLAMPHVFSSLRLLFGLAFGYIMLAELVKEGTAGGLGDILIVSQRRGPREHIYLVLMIIPLVALTIDLLLQWAERELFPHIHGGAGHLHAVCRGMNHFFEDVYAGTFGTTPAPTDVRRAAAESLPPTEQGGPQ
jgi:ABC-type nitrate/sulfonate/bicarbonate transport system permease component